MGTNFSCRLSALVAAVCVLAGCGNEVGEHVANGQAMGTSWRLQYSGQKVDAVEERVAARLKQLEGIFSTWDEESVVSRVNRGEEIDLPDEYQEVMALAEKIRVQSGGAFDVRVGEVVKEFGFGSGLGGRLDFSGIAKGYAVDEIGEMLEGLGVDEFLFELGGELLGRGARDWQVGLESADPESVGDLRRVIDLRDRAVATSGSYRQFRSDANHLIDLRTRKPVAHDCVAVSVVAESCALADAWATALVILGIEEGLALAEREGIEAYFVQRLDDGAFVEIRSGN